MSSAWLSRMAVLAALVLGACGGDDGVTPCEGTRCAEPEPELCGNGQVEVSTETCDDGNAVDGDGCSAQCRSECGNGSVDGDELCDDGNGVDDDGCSRRCEIESGYTCAGEPSECITPTGKCGDPYLVPFVDNGGTLTATAEGDTSASTDQVTTAPCDGFASGAGPDHVWRFTIAEPRDVRIAVDTITAFDAQIRLLQVACDTASEVPEHLGVDGCSDEFQLDRLDYIALPAGTYYIVIDSADDTEKGAYKFYVSSSPSLCGNGMLDEDERCDDGNTAMSDGCNERCDVELGYACTGAPSVCGSACGNGAIEMGEECDDGNTVPGDRCSPTCLLESTLLEIEPNNTGAQAQAVPLTNQQIRGTLPPNDADIFQITLTAPATIEFETYDTIIASSPYVGVGAQMMLDCRTASFIDTMLRVFPGTADPTMNAMALWSDDEDGDVSCSYIGPLDNAGVTTQGVMQPGTYFIKVSNFMSNTTERYVLDIKIATTAAVVPVAGDLVLNEFMAADNNSDTNCDGVTTGTNDEFLELVNTSTKVLDLTGLTIADTVATRHTFATAPSGSLTLAPGKAVVVWAGGAPSCPGVANWFTATHTGNTGGLGLNDLGDTITVKTATGDTLISHAYPSATLNVSSNRTPDLQGPTYVNHNTVPGAVGNFSPGKKANGTAF